MGLQSAIGILDRESVLRGMVRLGINEHEPGWVQCAAVDSEWYRRWEEIVARSIQREQGSREPRAVSAHALIWYAQIPGMLGGAMYRAARRVPELGRHALAFRLADGEGYPDAYALLSTRFWCLPTDPDVDSPDATVVEDEVALAAELRAQVRGHADDFLAQFQPAARLPRRALLGAFQDAIEDGIWVGRGEDVTHAEEILADGRRLFPGGVEFAAPSTLSVLTDDNGGDGWIVRDRIACCFRYRNGVDECATCPRVDDNRRRTLMAQDHH